MKFGQYLLIRSVEETRRIARKERQQRERKENAERLFAKEREANGRRFEQIETGREQDQRFALRKRSEGLGGGRVSVA